MYALVVGLLHAAAVAWASAPPTLRPVTKCVVKDSATVDGMQGAIDWACNGHLDCSPIEKGGKYYDPSLRRRAEWLVNAYFWQHADNDGSCDFAGIAELWCGERGVSVDKIRGVNLGGWLVMEPWITPSMFEKPELKDQAIDEYTFAHYLGYEMAKQLLTQHWDTWYTRDDFARIKQLGLNTVRLPVGYWAFGDYPPMVANVAYVDAAAKWCDELGLGMLIDLHGAPGSQNGFDNSGRTCGDKCIVDCPPAPSWMYNDTNVDLTLKVLQKFAQRYKTARAVIGIEVLNEPRWDIDETFLKKYYASAHTVLRQHGNPAWRIVFSDSFRYNLWRGFMANDTMVNLDAHVYQAFSPDDIKQTPDGHLRQSCGFSKMIDYQNCVEKPTIVGEWSLATNDCQKYLLGYKQPPTAPDYGVKCYERFEDQFYASYARAQLHTWERGAGWFFWTAKAEDAPMWSYFEAVERGWMPRNASALADEIRTACDFSTDTRAEPLGAGHRRAPPRGWRGRW